MIDLSNKRSLYNIYKKKKPNGKFRIIQAPKQELKLYQSILASNFEDIYDPPDCVHGFVKGRSPASLAANHTNKDWVITIDMKDFFPSITSDMLLSLGITRISSEIATLDGKLTQGSPCSPVCSNLVFRPLDIKFQHFFKRKKVRYDRYADDLVLSGYGKPSWSYVNYIKEMCALHGLAVNTSKTKFMFKNNEQKVLGITVNSGVSINHKTRKALKNKIKYEETGEKEQGYLSYINSISKEQYNRLKATS